MVAEKTFVEIIPCRVFTLNKVQFPIAGIAFDCLFALYGFEHSIEGFEPDEAFATIALRKTRH